MTLFLSLSIGFSNGVYLEHGSKSVLQIYISTTNISAAFLAKKLYMLEQLAHRSRWPWRRK